jgi:type IV secretion system protein VirB10
MDTLIDRMLRYLGIRHKDSRRPDDDTATAADEAERGIAAVATTRSLHSRIVRTLTIAMGVVLSVGFLVWYYSHAFTSRASAASAAARARSKLDDESVLPPLTVPKPSPTGPASPLPGTEPHYLIGNILGPAPTTSELTLAPGPLNSARRPKASAPTTATNGAPATKSAEELHQDRLLAGAVFTRSTGAEALVATASPSVAAARGIPAEVDLTAATPAAGAAGQGALVRQLTATVTAAAAASTLPTRRLLLPKGNSIDCTLETAIDSTLPGLTTCLTAVDTFSADGTVVLLERGTQLIGETAGNVSRVQPASLCCGPRRGPPTAS